MNSSAASDGMAPPASNPPAADAPAEPAKRGGLRTRILSALVLAPIALGLTYWGGIAFNGLMLIVAVLMAHEWNRRRDDPARDQHSLAPVDIRVSTRKVIRQRLADTKHDDERKNRGASRKMKFLLGNRRQDGAFQADHCTDESVNNNEQNELRKICPDS